MYSNKNKKEEKEIVKRNFEEIKREIVRETPDWKRLLKDGGLIDQITQTKYFHDSLKTTQLRKFFDVVKNIDYRLQRESWEKLEPELWQIVPAIKYAKGRNNVPEEFADFVSKMVEKITDSEDPKQIFLNFERVFESIVAYHKYHGGK
ncbi:type III-A CRISPR-associated protein Csm2 [Candidatus Aciduliprofundum boonei]|uniref:CRISPR system Cms protein Csm2 n=1 Tax=Aciduliprofundum boonei (strain DSM 19572 / T469) TaxID=439481 RepID=B5IHF3_ACIB4|nr:type III-A CRISPR-associated protein Csm2 [Candidatus Aciduliprofundum boonei]ADD08836.1 CRISPR-associated protein, Csm2 family [Aciduliprofundum boonei T469]EDY34294.1 conserved hypothetical protein [Aciduliprofundum boonei T469]HII55526.1 type III-A CRISPR-associated protein Csm2 [Candidatus Aciduliprofundum boonei]